MVAGTLVPVFTAPGEPKGIFALTQNEPHLVRRCQVNEFYTASAIGRISYRVVDVSRLFFDKLRNACEKGHESFDMCHKIRYYAFDAIANITVSEISPSRSHNRADSPQFGQPFGCVESDGDVNALIETIAIFIRYSMVVGAFVEWHPLIIRLLQALTPGRNKGYLHLKSIGESAMKRMDDSEASTAKEKTDPKKNSTQKPHSFVSVMQERHHRDPATFTRDDVTYHMLPNVIAGADTSGATLCAAVYYIWRNPTVLAGLREELDSWAVARGKRPRDTLISMAEAQELPYLQAVLKETMRVLPGVGFSLARLIPDGGLTMADQYFPAGV